MKKPIILLLSAFILSSCNFKAGETYRGNGFLERYENDEVVCFDRGRGLWCYKKTPEIVPCEAKKGRTK